VKEKGNPAVRGAAGENLLWGKKKIAALLVEKE